ncbi:MAG: helix-turn-helix transcriptional regulator [Bacillota bacterium]|jgi:predicted DNA-binding transcriptional regulator YafY
MAQESLPSVFSGAGSVIRGKDITPIGFWRLYQIHQLLLEGTYPNCPSIAKILEVSVRTVERDIDRLRDLFLAPIQYDRTRRGYYYAEPFELPPVRLGDGEAIALFLGQKLLAQCKGTPFEEFVKKAMAKIRLLLPQRVVVDVERTLGSVSFQAEPLRGEELEIAERYQLLAKAIIDRKSVLVEYYTVSRDEITHRKINPYHLRFSEGTWYCIGHCHYRNTIRTFALDRMLCLEATEDCFSVPDDFSVDEYLSHSLAIERGQPQKVVLEFDRVQAAYVRSREWHHSQTLEELPGGGLRMTLTVGGMGEVKRWVTGMGSHGWVVEPQELRDEIAQELADATARYCSVPQSRRAPRRSTKR